MIQFFQKLKLNYPFGLTVLIITANGKIKFFLLSGLFKFIDKQRHMERRNFLQQSALTGASLLAGATVFGKETVSPNADKPFNMLYGFHDGMFKNHGGNDFIDQIKFAYDKGFRSIEDNGMTGRSIEQQTKIGETLAKLGMTMGVFVVPGARGLPCRHCSANKM